MAKENIEELSIKILKRRKRIVLVLTITFIVIIAVNLVFIVASIGNEDRDLQFSYFIPMFLFVGIIIPMNMGVKKINKELARRNDN